MKGKQIVAVLLVSLIAIVGCSGSPNIPDSESQVREWILGEWVGDGERWTFDRSSDGYRASYLFSAHVPTDGEFKWEFRSGVIILQHEKGSDWVGTETEFKIYKLTKDRLVIELSKGNRIQLEKVEDQD